MHIDFRRGGIFQPPPLSYANLKVAPSKIYLAFANFTVRENALLHFDKIGKYTEN